MTPTRDLAFTIASDAYGHRVEFRSRPRLLTIAFAVLWFAGWLLLLTLTALDYQRFGSLNLLGVVLLAGGTPVALALLWVAFGKRESLLVQPAEVRIDRWVGPFRLSRRLEPQIIQGLRVAAASGSWLSDLVAVREFYSGGSGRVAFDTARRTFTAGQDLSDDDAARIVATVRELVPQLSNLPLEEGGLRVPAKSRATALMTMAMLGFALNVPVRLAITDRPICFYNEAASPREPIDVTARRPAGRVLVVPVDDFPIARAHAVAEHFRTKFGVAIDVAPAIAWPEGAYVPERRQMNAAVMLTHLEKLYPSTAQPVIAIALTSRDMFNPEVNWAYVFSYRRNNRMAVVSPARMDRGCMGLMPADAARTMARLQKMVGKNIGIMYFGLEMTDDPASMLYANIGGPQELDAMSDEF